MTEALRLWNARSVTGHTVKSVSTKKDCAFPAARNSKCLVAPGGMTVPPACTAMQAGAGGAADCRNDTGIFQKSPHLFYKGVRGFQPGVENPGSRDRVRGVRFCLPISLIISHYWARAGDFWPRVIRLNPVLYYPCAFQYRQGLRLLLVSVSTSRFIVLWSTENPRYSA